MGPDELASYVEHAGSAASASTELGLRNTQLRLVEPFLECLGWDVRSPAVEAAFTVEGCEAVVDYALLVDGEPAVFVDTLACESTLGSAAGEALLSTMDAAGVEWGILTNGRRFAFVARREDREDGFTCSLAELPAHADDLERFSPERAGEYVRGRERRLDAASAIAERRDDLVDTVVAELRSVAGEDGEAVPAAELRSVTDSFVDEVLATVTPDGETVSAVGGDEPTAEETSSSSSEPASVAASTAPASRRDDRSGPSSRRDTGGRDDGGDASPDEFDDATHAPMTDDGEYIARLFKDRTSIGAVGGSSVAGTMKEAADYLLEQHHLDAGLSLPYVPDDGGYAVLNRVPQHPNGEPMDEFVELDAGAYLWTAGTLEERRDRIEALAREAGLRVMFQGDWKPR